MNKGKDDCKHDYYVNRGYTEKDEPGKPTGFTNFYGERILLICKHCKREYYRSVKFFSSKEAFLNYVKTH